MASGAPSSVVELAPQGPLSTQVTFAGAIPVAVPLLRRSKGVAVPVADSEEECVYKVGEDPEIKALFEGFEPSQSTSGAFYSRNAEKHGFLSSSSHFLNDIIFYKEFPTWPTDIRRRLIRDYRVRIGAKPFSSLIAGAEEELPKPVINLATRVDSPGAMRHKAFQEVLLGQGCKAVLQSDLAKAAKVSSKRKRDSAPLSRQVML